MNRRDHAFRLLLAASRLNRWRKIGHGLLFLRAACALLDSELPAPPGVGSGLGATRAAAACTTGSFPPQPSPPGPLHSPERATGRGLFEGRGE